MTPAPFPSPFVALFRHPGPVPGPTVPLAMNKRLRAHRPDAPSAPERVRGDGRG